MATLDTTGLFHSETEETWENAHLHLPVIETPAAVRFGEPFEVAVQVAQDEHPSQWGHFIQFIELYVGPVFLARLDLVPTMTCPALRVHVRLDKDMGSLRAVSFCNVHGAWESYKSLNFEPGPSASN